MTLSLFWFVTDGELARFSTIGGASKSSGSLAQAVEY